MKFLPAPAPLLMLPAPRIAGYLPAWTAPEPTRVTRPLAALNPGEEQLLVNLYTHQQALVGGRPHLGEDGTRWMPIGKHARKMADMLVSYGYAEKHPAKRRRMWYGLTDDGTFRAQAALKAQATDDENPAPPDIIQARRRVFAGTSTGQDGHLVLRWERLRTLQRLARELTHQGFVMYHEAGRFGHGEQAFYNLWTREMVLYRVRGTSINWELRRGGYFKPAADDDDLAVHLRAMEKANF